MMRRRTLLAGAAVFPALAALPARAAKPLKIGLLEDTSGDLAIFGIPKLHGATLAVSEINAAGGIRGRQAQLIHLDPGGDNARYQALCRRLLEEERVDVLFGGITSASREAIRPIVDRLKAVYFYTNQYEGGVCDANTICIGEVPEQQLSTLIPWMVKKYGKRVYTIAADYNFGHISAAWGRKLLEPLGGTVVGEEFIPLGVSQFAQTIQNIQRAKPDWVYTLNVGAAQNSFFPQAAAAHLDLPMGSPIKIALGFEHKTFPPPDLYNMHATADWFQEIDTPEADAFKKRWFAMWPHETYINSMGYNAYIGIFVYKALAEVAASTQYDDIHRAIAKGVSIDAPEGRISLDPKSQHMSHVIRLFSVDKNNVASETKNFGLIQPYWLDQIGCDLMTSNPHAQYTPDNLPKKA
jgi:branched-chain amino acid transport system substrate-binding protein